MQVYLCTLHIRCRRQIKVRMYQQITTQVRTKQYISTYTNYAYFINALF